MAIFDSIFDGIDAFFSQNIDETHGKRSSKLQMLHSTECYDA